MSAVRTLPSAAQPMTSTTTRPKLLTALTIITPIAILIGVYFALVYAGQEAQEGDVQRIFYLHVSAFAGAFVAFGATVFAGLAYLRTRNPKWDKLGVAGVEVGLVLGLMNLTTGSIWAYPTWNTWWTWDPRLTSDAIMCLTYVAYLMLRQGIENVETRHRFAAVYGILAYSTVIITFIITRIRPDTIHPVVIGNSPQNAQGGFALTPSMIAAISVNSIIWSILVPWVLVWWRIRLENQSQRVQAKRAQLMEQ
jgi:heme exporter protein C